MHKVYVIVAFVQEKLCLAEQQPFLSILQKEFSCLVSVVSQYIHRLAAATAPTTAAVVGATAAVR